ncbi:hypothetical protein DPMN_091545 [Dreissena polymorpha]|uniref:Uncharacterized protein n=1 Tax=Dreissena polymorpha TaxID=45954 RepID=A0A9D4QZC1_DREPO|nr:hypothetical protein DPMN_091545 [Dreissena polymorpha]
MKFHDPSHKTNVLSKFHENWAKKVTSTVFTCFHYIHIEKNAPPTGGHDFHRSRPFSNSSETSIKPIRIKKTAPPTGGHTSILTNFELGRDFIGTKLLTKFHEDGTRNQMLTDGRTDGHTTDKDRSQKLT